jgi:hypothetical protein
MEDLDKLLVAHVNSIRKDLNFIYNCRKEHVIGKGGMMEINKYIENWKDIIKNSYEIKISYSYITPPPIPLEHKLLMLGLITLSAIQENRSLKEKIEEHRDKLFDKQKKEIKNFEITEKYKNPLEPSENIEYDISYDSYCCDNRTKVIISAMEEIIKEAGFNLGRDDYKLKVEINYKGERISENPKINIERGENYLLYIEKDTDINYELSIKLTKERYNENDYLS